MRSRAPSARPSRKTAPTRFRPWLEPLEDRLVPAAFVVNTLADTVDANPATTSLREAILAANAAPDADTIDINVQGTISLGGALPDLVGTLSIRGRGADVLTVARGTDGDCRLFTVAAGATITLEGITMSNGRADVGGGILNDGTMTIDRCNIQDNVSYDSELRNEAVVAGGGILNLGTMTVRDSSILRNVSQFGGGIDNQGDLTLERTRVAFNTSGSVGGGIKCFDARSLTVTDCVIDNNQCGSNGAGVYATGTDVLISGSTIEHNGQIPPQGGVFLVAPGGGAAFGSGDRTVTVVNTTFTENGSPAGGGAVYLLSGSATFINCTFFANRSGNSPGEVILPDFHGGAIAGNDGTSVTLHNDLIFGNTVGNGLLSDLNIAVTPDSRNNLIGVDQDVTGISDGVGGNRIGTLAAPLTVPLGSLADNGGPTPTLALLPGGLAVDGGWAGPGFPTTDQRGLPRDAAPDIGAFESQSLTARAGGPYTVPEGGTVRLDASGSSDERTSGPLTYAWDLDGDGVFGETGAAASNGDETGITPTFFAAGLDGPSVFTVQLRVTDDAGLTSTASAVINITNSAPAASVTGPTDGVPGQPRTFTLAASDPSSADMAAGFTYAITWGDGSSQTVGTTPGNGAGTTVEHIFSQTGTFTVGVTATDKDNGVSTTVTHVVTIEAVQIQGADLVVGGTTADDRIIINPGGPGTVQVILNGVAYRGYSPTGRILVYGQAGDDTIQVAGGVRLPAWLFGGAGNDTLQGGGGDDVLVGGPGNDVLMGGQGRDLLIGGAGADRLSGNADEDILIAGTTAFDDSPAALDAIMAEWTSARSYADRVANLRGAGTGPRNNGNVFLKVSGPDVSVYDDAAVDVLSGASSSDWFFANLSCGMARDIIDGLSRSEVVEDLGARVP